MAWKKINLFGYDPTKHDFSTTTFNIKQALNDNWTHLKELIEEIRERISESETELTSKVDKEAGKGLSSNDFDDAYKAKLDGLETEFGKYETKSTMIAATIFASGWSDGQYSFEDSYPNATYDLSVEPDSTCTEAQLDAWSGARIVGNSAGNVLKAFGDVPTVDIPVILEVKKK